MREQIVNIADTQRFAQNFYKFSAVCIKYVVCYHLPLETIIGMYQAIRPSVDGLLECLLVFNMPFTFFKGLLDVALCFLIYKPLSPLLHK